MKTCNLVEAFPVLLLAHIIVKRSICILIQALHDLQHHVCLLVNAVLDIVV